MTTLDALQTLSDEAFHRLCDDLLRRVEARFAALTPHGINREGKSIRGQPDAYVGPSAATGRIAFEYSVQAAAWWGKIIKDVRTTVFGVPSDQQNITPHVDHPDVRSANLAYEAMCRLTDPLRLPRHWDSL